MEINEERMGMWKYSSILKWFGRRMGGNVHLEKMRQKAEKGGARIGYMSGVNLEIEMDRGKIIWELLAIPCL